MFQPKVKAKAWSPGSRNSTWNVRSLDCAGLADQLVQPLLRDRALAGLVGIRAVIGTGRLAVDRHTEPDRLAVCARPEHEMQVAGVEAERDAARRAVERRLSAERVQLPASAH